MMRIAAGGDVDGGGELRVGAGEVEHELAVLDGERHSDPARKTLDAVLVHIVREEIFSLGDAPDDVARLLLAVVEEISDALAEHLRAEALDHLMHFALAGPHGGDLGLEVTPV